MHLNDPEANREFETVEKLDYTPPSEMKIKRDGVSTVFDVPVTKTPNVKGVADKTYEPKIGAELSHPLSLITMILNDCAWVDHAVKTIAASCASTVPLFRFFTSDSVDGRNKKLSADKKVKKLREKLMFPNPHQTGFELFLTTFENLAGYGNAYWQIIRTRSGDIHSIYTLPPESMRVIPYYDVNRIMHTAYYQENVVKKFNDESKDGNYYFEDEIIHFKDTNERSFLYGKPRCYPLITMITSDLNSQQAIANWFEEGFSAGMIFKMDADEAVANRNRDYLREMYSGVRNFGKVMLLEGSTELESDGNKFIGNINFKPLADLHRDNILQAMGVPLSMAGVRSEAGQANIEVINSEEKVYKTNTVSKYHRIVFDKINAVLLRRILTDYNDIEIGPGILSKFSLNTEIKAVEALSKLGIGLGEAREIMGMAELPSEKAGETYILITNNGAADVRDILGIDFNTGEVTETLMEKGLKNDGTPIKPAAASGLGGQQKKMAEGK